jgi:glycosyltransferase involved in cell wall biosynthesis
LKFLFLGSFTARKGLPLLLKAWDELDIPDAELTIAGYGKLPASVVLSPNVKNLGTIAKEERQHLFDNADVFLFPSFFEGLAQVQIEAMACGLPVVGTKNSGADELVEEGVNGFIIEAGNSSQLKAAINFFLSSPMKIKHMGIKAREKAEEFSWDAYGARLKRILEDTAANKKADNA